MCKASDIVEPRKGEKESQAEGEREIEKCRERKGQKEENCVIYILFSSACAGIRVDCTRADCIRFNVGDINGL